MYKELKECILCGSKELIVAIDLGTQYVVDFVKEKDESLLKAPLTLMRCTVCNLLQLKHRVSPDRLYRKFWYRSGINEQMRDELLAIVKKASATIELRDGDKVLDIGANDGTLLGWYPKGVTTFGVDPCKELINIGLTNGKIDVAIPDFFSEESFRQYVKVLGIPMPKFKVITAVAMFYDVENPIQFLKDCKAVLHDEGVLVIQMNYLMSMLKDTAIDNVCHEHLAYYSVTTFRKAVEKAGLDLQGIELSPCNGGSFRAYVTHKSFVNWNARQHSNKLWLYTNSQVKMLEEDRAWLNSDIPYLTFAVNIDAKKKKILAWLESMKDKRVYAYGASTRGTVLTQYLFKDGGADQILAVAERDATKVGLKMVGTWWPIVDETEFRNNADAAICLPWHFRESITKREKDWIAKGGELLFPLPEPVVVSKQEIEVVEYMPTGKTL